jgi:hypothetical protein
VPVDNPIVGLIFGVPVRQNTGLQSAGATDLLEDRVVEPDRVVRVREAADRVNVLGSI